MIKICDFYQRQRSM